MCAEALSCYVHPEASYFTASFIGMSRNVCSLFQLGVFLLSCPRHAFAVFVSALFPTFLTALLTLRVRCCVMARSMGVLPCTKCSAGKVLWQWQPEPGCEAVKQPGEGAAQEHFMAAQFPAPCKHLCI